MSNLKRGFSCGDIDLYCSWFCTWADNIYNSWIRNELSYCILKGGYYEVVYSYKF